MNVLGDDIDPLDLAWKQFGPHWMCSLFDMGNIWLVNASNMSSKQQQLLGLQLRGLTRRDSQLPDTEVSVELDMLQDSNSQDATLYKGNGMRADERCGI